MPDNAAAIDPYSMTPDEARQRLVRDGVNMMPDLKDALTRRASGMDAPSPRAPMALSPFGTGHLEAALTPAQAADLDPNGETVYMRFPRPVKLLLPGGRRVQFGVGDQPVPRILSSHPYLGHNGVEHVDPPPQRAATAGEPEAPPRAVTAAEADSKIAAARAEAARLVAARKRGAATARTAAKTREDTDAA